MREGIRAFVDSAAGAFELQGPVYQFGSCSWGEANSQTSLRESFAQAVYVRLGADDANEVGRLPIPDGAARTVLCVGTTAQSFQAHRAIEEMQRILSPGGAMLVCAPIQAPALEPMVGHWQMTPRAVGRLLEAVEVTLIGWQGASTCPHTIYGLGFKPPVPSTVAAATGQFLESFQARLDAAARTIGWRRRMQNMLRACSPSRSRRQHVRDYHNVQFAVCLSADGDHLSPDGDHLSPDGDHLSPDGNVGQPLVQRRSEQGKTGTRLDFRL